MAKKFKVIENNASNDPNDNSEWEGEELQAQSQTKLEDDLGEGQEIILRFFDFAANPEVFKQHQPTAQQLFESHRRGIEAILWTDGLSPYQVIEPRLLFSKDKTKYRFIISCVPSLGNILVDKTHTLSELLTIKKT